ncbi:MAG: hypothetical protein LBV69_09540 [Bacteroidales bacterium]|jgi:malate dehydrogenase (oxaloacetate-decarboxylating)(NADP+)|nr:hypothetical protein [Bacteroidales bacterium]
MSLYTTEEALAYHSKGRKGKIEVVPAKDFQTQKDLALAYSPGVALPSLEIAENAYTAYNYTAKSNLVGVISNGTAVLGLGNIGAQAAKPVMEGKGLLFKIFADIDVFDIEIDEKDPEKFIEIVKTLEPTFGGINLEDIKSPECFVIEETLKREMNIPVFHDDQHGTAVIVGAALINSLKIINKKIEDISIVINGAGAAGISCAKLIVLLGAKMENIVMCDSKGIIRIDSASATVYQQKFATAKNIFTLGEAMNNVDVFIGVSVANVVSKEMLLSMNENPIVFALANPDPEITYEEAIAVRRDLIFATGRSDYPNQVNNVLGFPFIFRGALDVRATQINDEMKIAASLALANLAMEDVPKYVCEAYNIENLQFGKDYIIPKPLDLRVIEFVAVAVAQAAIKSGAARIKIDDWEEYRINLRNKVERVHMNYLMTKVKI